jgi:hypothetical protein
MFFLVPILLGLLLCSQSDARMPNYIRVAIGAHLQNYISLFAYIKELE